MNLTGEQIRAIETLDGNLQIIACAGSGKTQVVSARVVETLKRKQSEGIKPENIVAFTFTDKASPRVKRSHSHASEKRVRRGTGISSDVCWRIHGFCGVDCQRRQCVDQQIKMSLKTNLAAVWQVARPWNWL
jgi:ATP-dependent DNA helicase UvrD/PcrA